MAAATALLGDPVREVSRQQGGGNNRLYRVEAADSRRYALKTYLQRPGDDRDRLGRPLLEVQVPLRSAHGRT